MRIPFLIPVLLGTFAEIAVFILVGDAIGVLPTLGLTLLSMIVGAVLLKRQGVAALNNIRAEVARGRVPARPVAEAAMVAVAGFLLIVPGFLTGAAGLLLFIPAVRSAIWGRMRRQLEMRVQRRQSFRPRAALSSNWSPANTSPRRDPSDPPRTRRGVRAAPIGADLPTLFGRSGRARRAPAKRNEEFMADTSSNGGAAQPAPAASTQPGIHVLGQYIKDLSFENPNAPRSLRPSDKAPKLDVNVNVNARPQSEAEFEIELKLDAKAVRGDETLFIAEVSYAACSRSATCRRSTCTRSS
jgi:UPF0716 family protein affecting phage T7 exclusion